MNKNLKISPHVRYRLIEDETLIINQDSNQLLVANAIGARILDLIKKGHTLQEIEQILAQEYHVGDANVAEDLDSFCSRLVDEKILQPTANERACK